MSLSERREAGQGFFGEYQGYFTGLLGNPLFFHEKHLMTQTKGNPRSWLTLLEAGRLIQG
jgi:hypothetical protein